MRSSRWMLALIAYGSPRVRTIQASGVMSSRFALCASGICAHGTYMIGCGSRFSPPSRTSPAMPTIWRPASSMPRAQSLADRDPVGQRVAGSARTLRHRLVDDRDAGRAAGVLIGERAAPHDGNLEGAEVGRRDRRETAAAVRRPVERPPFDDDRQAEPALERHAARGARDLDAGQRIQPLGAVAHQLRDRGGIREPLAPQRHAHRQHLVRVESGVDGAQCEEGADEQRRADQQHQRQPHLGDHQQRARLVLPEPAARSAAAFLDRRVQVERATTAAPATGRTRALSPPRRPR